MMDLVEIKPKDPFILQLMYAGKNNISLLNAYELVGLGNRCFAHRDVYEKLLNLIPILNKGNYKLKIFDAYRPPQAHVMLMNRIPVKGLFADTAFLSQHCHGTAIDVCLTDKDGHEFDFPTTIDAYTPELAQQLSEGQKDNYMRYFAKAAYSYESPDEPEKMKNRALLCQMMESVGFLRHEEEWWHFNLPNKDKYPMIEFSVDEKTKDPVFTPATNISE